jgi:formylglycine-generating enzyme required for sulfatase activity
VILQGIDKKEISLPLTKLSAADQQYVKARLTSDSRASKTITNTIGMKLIKIPAGTFLMGSPAREKGRGDHEDQHKVTISKAFYMQTTEVTQGQWMAVMGTEPWLKWLGQRHVKEGPNYPAFAVTWTDAVAYCKKLSEKESKTYRLPTEAEWEYACRAGTQTAWSFGNDEKALRDYAWYNGIPNEQYHHQGGLKKPNAFGLYDMHGNVSEWCHDYTEEHYYKQSPEKDPQGPATGKRRRINGLLLAPSRVLRGGSWYDGTRRVRSAGRSGGGENYRNEHYGFRLVRELD